MLGEAIRGLKGVFGWSVMEMDGGRSAGFGVIAGALTLGREESKLRQKFDTCGIRTHAGKPNNLAGYHLNHSAKVSFQCTTLVFSPYIELNPRDTRPPHPPSSHIARPHQRLPSPLPIHSL